MEKKYVRDRTGLQQIAFDTPIEWHAIIKKRAHDQNMSMRKWIMKACENQLKEEEKLGWK
ncbi:MAG TPA: hypothetical protein VHA52_02275 [Candidatus Babeliaceae bacterium]|nr:hypothetical protein [Candidatus Babeliaceae bacterium]